MKDEALEVAAIVFATISSLVNLSAGEERVGRIENVWDEASSFRPSESAKE